MTPKFLALACLLLCIPAVAMAQQQQRPKHYVPFPADFEKMDDKKKEEVLHSIDHNTDMYFHSDDYRQAIATFVTTNNPDHMNDCAGLSMDRTEGKNMITVVEPLLFAAVTDRHPLVGKWEHSAAFKGCGKTFAFTIEAKGNKAQVPLLSLKK